ncbi:MAG TPA: hypothetical protein VIJ11_11580 [Galbitalea sp.]
MTCATNKSRMEVKNGAMTPQQLEAAVLAAVDQLKSHNQVEDDRIELKREWPGANKARQLAAAANRANGSFVIYIIGVDESNGEIAPTTGVDPADWWAQISARFDQVAPELRNHINVHYGNGEVVTALLFATDRAPYVVKNEAGHSPEFEVPIREGTRTRSAHRDELLRMLIPAVTAPPALLLSAHVSAQWFAAQATDAYRQGRDECTQLSGAAKVFLEYSSSSGILLPVHEMSAELSNGETTVRARVTVRRNPKGVPPPPTFGVEVRPDGVAVTGPGAFTCRFGATLIGDERALTAATASWELRLSFGVTGSPRPVRLSTHLAIEPLRPNARVGAFSQTLERWSFGD